MDQTLYDQVGGQPFFGRLVGAFYERVEADELLRAMYPDDLTDSKQRLALFLAQYWGGPPLYMEYHGHPRLRLRHAPFSITKGARDAWLGAMTAALQSVRDELSDSQFQEMSEHFATASTQLRNV